MQQKNNIITQNCISNFQGHKNAIQGVCFSPDEKYIVSCSHDNTIRFWSIAEQKVSKIIKNDSGLTCLKFTPNGQFLVTGDNQCNIKVWNHQKDSDQLPRTYWKVHTNTVTSICFTSNGEKMISASSDKSVIIWNFKNGEVNHKLNLHSLKVNQVCLNPVDENILASCSDDKTVIISEIQSGKQISVLKGHKSKIDCLCFSPSGEDLVTGSNDGTIKIWKTNNWSFQRQFEFKKEQGYWSLHFSLDGQYLISGQSKGYLYFWNFNSGQIERELLGHSEIINSINLSKDQTLLATGSHDSTVKIWRGFEKKILFEKSIITSDQDCLIGEGSSGKVYKVFIDQKECAQKLIEINMSNKDQKDLCYSIEVLLNEINIMQKITIDSLHQNFNTVKLKGIALNYLRRQNNEILQVALFQDLMKSDLDTFMKSPKGKQLQTKKRILIQLCDSLIYFTEQKLAHGDLKPSNVMIDSNDDAQIGDFGTATIVQSTSEGKGGRLFAYTTRYAAPEMLKDSQKYIESDYWSLGAIILEYLLQKRPYGNLQQIQILNELNSQKSYYDYYLSNGGQIKSEIVKSILVGCSQIERKQRMTPQKIKELLQMISENDF